MISYDFSDKVVVVTGAARGVGRSIVLAFADSGARIVAADRDADGLAETAGFARGSMAQVEADISTPEGASNIIATALERFGRLDVCVNDAAVAPHASLLEE